MAGALAQAAGTTLDDLTKNPMSADLSAMAGPAQAATTYTPNDEASVSGQLGKLLSKESDYMTRARTKAAQASNSRGLLNSTMAATAGEAAAIDAALPIAQADAATNFTAQRDNAGALNAFASDANAFGRDAAKTKFSGALSLASQQLDLAQDDKKLALSRDQLDADTAYRNADLSFRTNSADRELGLKDKELSMNDSFRRDQLAQTKDQQAATLAQEAERLKQQAASSLTNNIASIRQQASQAQAALESDPNMSGEAKANAIVALSQKASADIAELVRFSGINMPQAWPDWVNQIGTDKRVIESGVNAGGPGGGGSISYQPAASSPVGEADYWPGRDFGGGA